MSEVMRREKTVCHITDVHGRYDERIFRKQCRSLAAAGYQVYLVVSDDKPDEVLDGVHIISTGRRFASRKERFRHGPRLVLEKALSVKADLYQIHDPELLTILQKLEKTGAKVVYDSHEDTEQQILDKTYIPAPFLKIVSKIYSLYSAKVFAIADGLISVSPLLVKKLRRYNMNVEMVTNYPILREVRGGGYCAENQTVPYVFFAGGVSSQWMHDVIINAVNGLDGVRYVLAGTSTEEYLDHLRSLDGWNKTEYLGSIPRSDVDGYYDHALAGMAVNYSTQAKGEGTLGNTKLFEVMEAGKPVICTGYRLWREIVEGGDCGICVKPDDVDSVRNAINYLLENPDKAAEMGANGRRLAEETYNWDTQKEKLLAFYEKLLA